MRQLALAIPFQRLVGFTVPHAGQFFVCDHNEAWIVRLGDTVEVIEVDNRPYDLAKRLDFVGWGETANEVRRAGDALIDYAVSSSHAVVRYEVGSMRGELEFHRPSGDWFAASLSDDGSYLVLAEPDSINLFATAGVG